MVITVMRDGSVYFGNGRVAPDELKSRIMRSLNNRSVERKIYIRTDQRVHYSRVRDTLDEVRDAGIEEVAFLVH